MKTTILTTELLSEIKNKIDNGTWDFESGNMADSEKACEFLNKQKWSLKYLKEYFSKCDTTFVSELLDDGVDMVNAFVREAAPNIAEERCSRFAWNGVHYSDGWDLRTTAFCLDF